MQQNATSCFNKVNVDFRFLKVRACSAANPGNLMDCVNTRNDFERALPARYVGGKVDATAIKAILAAHCQEVQT